MKKADRLKIYNKFDGHCAYCGRPIKYKAMQVDHILAVMRGGKSIEENFYPSCRSCNATKATYTIEEFRERLVGDIYRLRRDSSKFRILERFGLVTATEDPLIFYFERQP